MGNHCCTPTKETGQLPVAPTRRHTDARPAQMQRAPELAKDPAAEDPADLHREHLQETVSDTMTNVLNVFLQPQKTSHINVWHELQDSEFSPAAIARTPDTRQPAVANTLEQPIV